MVVAASGTRSTQTSVLISTRTIESSENIQE